jgi:hypothetical protein
VPGPPAPGGQATRDAGASPAAEPPPLEAGVSARDAARAQDAPDGALEAPRRDDGPPEAASDAGADAPPPPPPGEPPGPGDVVIDEILVDPAGNDLGREWVEIANAAGHALDLSGLHLSDGTTDVGVDGGLLPPGGLLVLGQSIDPTRNGGAPVAVAYGTRLQLNNGGDMLALCLGACAAGVVLDAFSWDASLGTGYVGRAIVIDRSSGSICPAMQPFGTGGSFGSPGQPNPPCVTETDGGAPEAGDASSEGP